MNNYHKHVNFDSSIQAEEDCTALLVTMQQNKTRSSQQVSESSPAMLVCSDMLVLICTGLPARRCTDDESPSVVSHRSSADVSPQVQCPQHLACFFSSPAPFETRGSGRVSVSQTHTAVTTATIPSQSTDGEVQQQPGRRRQWQAD